MSWCEIDSESTSSLLGVIYNKFDKYINFTNDIDLANLK